MEQVTISPPAVATMQAASGTTLLQGGEQKELALVVKDYLFLQRMRLALRRVLRRDPSIAEWAKAAKMPAA